MSSGDPVLANIASENPLETPNAQGPAAAGKLAMLKQFLTTMGGLAPKQGAQPQNSPGMQGQVLPPPTLPGVGARPSVMPQQAGQGQGQGPQPNQTTASYGGPATRPQSGMSGETTGYNFPNKSARNMAVTQGAIKSITEAVTQFKQQRWQKEAAQAEQVAGNYVTLMQKADEEQDPQQKQRLMQLAEQMKSDKGVMKVLEKAQKDPMSGAAVGLQRAMQNAMGKSQQTAALEGLRAKAAQAYATAQKEQAEAERATAEATKARSEAALAAEKARAESPEGLLRKHQMDMEKTKALEAGRTQRTKEIVQGAMERNKNSVAGLIKSATIRADAMRKVHESQTAKDSKLGAYFNKEYDTIRQTVNTLNVQQNALQKHVDTQSSGINALKWWNSTDIQVTQGKIAAIEKQREQLNQRMAQIDKQRDMAVLAGALPTEAVPEDTLAPDTGPTGGEEDGASPDSAITIQ